MATEKHKCYGCEELRDDCILGPDPYASEINGNEEDVWECPNCRYESAMDI